MTLLAAVSLALAGFVFAPAAASAASTSVVPAAGNWEGTGPHGLPMSFALARRGGHLVATAIALGAPLSCPPNERDTEAVPLSKPTYSGPSGVAGSAPSPATAPAVLSGVPPKQTTPVFATGRFTSAGTGTFSARIAKNVGCGWPQHVLTWQVHLARRGHVADGRHVAGITGPGVTSGAVRVTVAAHGRVIQAFFSSFGCVNQSFQSGDSFKAVPAYEFIRPNRTFYSPQTGNTIKGRTITWSGRFSARGILSGTLTTYDACTNSVVRLHFRGRRGA